MPKLVWCNSLLSFLMSVTATACRNDQVGRVLHDPLWVLDQEDFAKDEGRGGLEHSQRLDRSVGVTFTIVCRGRRIRHSTLVKVAVVTDHADHLQRDSDKHARQRESSEAKPPRDNRTLVHKCVFSRSSIGRAGRRARDDEVAAEHIHEATVHGRSNVIELGDKCVLEPVNEALGP